MACESVELGLCVQDQRQHKLQPVPGRRQKPSKRARQASPSPRRPNIKGLRMHADFHAEDAGSEDLLTPHAHWGQVSDCTAVVLPAAQPVAAPCSATPGMGTLA